MVALNEPRRRPGMSPVSLLPNILWIVFGGLWMAVAWMIAAVVMAITIIGLPWTRAAFNIGAYLSAKKQCLAPNIMEITILALDPLGFLAMFCSWFSPVGGWRSAIWSQRSCWL